MKILNVVQLIATFAVVSSGHAQGFLNLDFEAANISSYPPGSIPTSNGIPGWTAYIGGVSQNSMLYNDVSLGEAAISLQGTNGVYPSFQAQFSVLLQATFFASHVNIAAIGQTGVIPLSAQSIVFYANISLSGVANNMQLTFNGGVLPYEILGNGSGYTIYGADISSLAGQSGQLLFTAFNNTYAEIDNIQFSLTPIPEPATWALLVCGAGAFALHRRRRK